MSSSIYLSGQRSNLFFSYPDSPVRCYFVLVSFSIKPHHSLSIMFCSHLLSIVGNLCIMFLCICCCTGRTTSEALCTFHRKFLRCQRVLLIITIKFLKFRDIGFGNTWLLQCRGDYDHIFVPETGSTPFCMLTRDAFELPISSKWFGDFFFLHYSLVGMIILKIYFFLLLLFWARCTWSC